jgi:hypothetical protein
MFRRGSALSHIYHMHIAGKGHPFCPPKSDGNFPGSRCEPDKKPLPLVLEAHVAEVIRHEGVATHGIGTEICACGCRTLVAGRARHASLPSPGIDVDAKFN